MNRPSFYQLEKLMDFLEKNPSIAKGNMRTNQARLATRMKWEDLALELNRMKGALKDAKGWAKVWIDKKYWLKKSVARRSSIGDVQSLPPLTKTEERMLQIVFEPGSTLGNSEQNVPLGVSIKSEEPLRSDEAEAVSEDPLTGEGQTGERQDIEVVVDPLLFGPRRKPRPPRRRVHTNLITESERLIRIEEKRVEAELKHAAGWESVGAGLNALATAITEAGERCERGLEAIANAIMVAGASNPQPPKPYNAD